LASGWPEEAAAKVRMAEWVYRQYQPDKLDDREGRRALPPFLKMRATALRLYLLNDPHPVIYSVWAWQRETETIKRECYDDVSSFLPKIARAQNLDPQKAFPPPSGMDEWRKRNPKPARPEDLIKEQREKARAAK
jgi:hypothetical protein